MLYALDGADRQGAVVERDQMRRGITSAACQSPTAASTSGPTTACSTASAPPVSWRATTD